MEFFPWFVYRCGKHNINIHDFFEHNGFKVGLLPAAFRTQVFGKLKAPYIFNYEEMRSLIKNKTIGNVPQEIEGTWAESFGDKVVGIYDISDCYGVNTDENFYYVWNKNGSIKKIPGTIGLIINASKEEIEKKRGSDNSIKYAVSVSDFNINFSAGDFLSIEINFIDPQKCIKKYDYPYKIYKDTLYNKTLRESKNIRKDINNAFQSIMSPNSRSNWKSEQHCKRIYDIMKFLSFARQILDYDKIVDYHPVSFARENAVKFGFVVSPFLNSVVEYWKQLEAEIIESHATLLKIR